MPLFSKTSSTRHHSTPLLDLGDLGLMLLLGLFPVLFLFSLQAALALALIGSLLSWKTLGRLSLGWQSYHLAALQFGLFFLINAAVFDSWDGNRTHYKGIALEAWSGFLIAQFVLMTYLRAGRSLWPAFRYGLPWGLLGSFVIMTGFYLTGVQGSQAAAFGATSLGPPMWFLALSLLSFAGYERITSPERVLRLAIFALALVMAFYANARLVLLAWGCAAFAVTLWVVWQGPKAKRGLWALVLGGALVALVCAVIVVDQMGNGHMALRMTRIWNALQDPASASEHFLRLHIWTAALEVARENLWLGVGQINERLAIHEVLEHKSWFRAHQTYLSYVIAGGILALLSGILFQIAPLLCLRGAGQPAAGSWRFAAAGFTLVCAANGLTDSVFQSFTNTQGYCLVILLFAAARRSPPEAG